MGKTTRGRRHLAPPGPMVCQTCAVRHEPDLPHDLYSLYFQYWFYAEYRRWPSWADAMAHCTAEVQAQWVEVLRELELAAR